jgi:hypothetical protein
MKIEYLRDAEAHKTAAFAILAECPYFTRLDALTVTCRPEETLRIEYFSIVKYSPTFIGWQRTCYHYFAEQERA